MTSSSLCVPSRWALTAAGIIQFLGEQCTQGLRTIDPAPLMKGGRDTQATLLWPADCATIAAATIQAYCRDLSKVQSWVLKQASMTSQDLLVHICEEGAAIFLSTDERCLGSHPDLLGDWRKKMAWFMTPPMAPPALTSPQTIPRDLRDTKGTTPYTAPQVACTRTKTRIIKMLQQTCDLNGAYLSQ